MTLQKFLIDNPDYTLKSKLTSSDITEFWITNAKKKYIITSRYFNCDVEKTSKEILNQSMDDCFVYIRKVAFNILNEKITYFGSNFAP